MGFFLVTLLLHPMVFMVLTNLGIFCILNWIDMNILNFFFLFSCFSCSNDLCSFSQRLSGGEVNISGCLSLNCPGNMKLKKSLNGYYIACSNLACKSAVWFPKCVKNGVCFFYSKFDLFNELTF